MPHDDRTPATDATSARTPPEEHSLHIVGLGASAGGLDALGGLLERMQKDSIALVVVQHLATNHDSLLPTLLARRSRMEVLAIEDGMKVQANHVYVLPPNRNLALLHGVLHLMPSAPRPGARFPIDSFFRSLAEDQGAHAIGVILSGTGTDGTFGLKAIKEAGGITFVQEPESARFDGMPRSALESGWADFCMPVEQIAEEILRASSRKPVARPKRKAALQQDTVGKLLILIRSTFGADLTYYKHSTIERRI